MKKYKSQINNILNIALIYFAFYAGQGELNPIRWESTMYETFIFYVVGYFILREISKFKV